MDIQVKVRFVSAFKDGNIQHGRLFKSGEVCTIPEMDADKIQRSGGEFEVIEKLIPNPKKAVKEKDSK